MPKRKKAEDTCSTNNDSLGTWELPTCQATETMMTLAQRFRSETIVIEEHMLDTGAPFPQDPYRLEIHPASGDFFDAIHNDGWVMPGWDYSSWYEEHNKEFRSEKWIKTLTLRDIQKWLTCYSRELRWSSLYPNHSITQDVQSGVILKLLDRITSFRVEQ